jgi:hypothetical protein
MAKRTATAKAEALQEIRQRLTSDIRPGQVRFSSIILEKPGSEGQRPAIRIGGNVIFCLGVFPDPPMDVLGHLFQEDSGTFLAELQTTAQNLSEHQLKCSFVLPPDLPSASLCLAIEGRWLNQAAGCEMSFDVGS